MKYASYSTVDSGATWGVEADGVLYDLGPSGLNLAPTLKAAVINGVFGDENIDVTKAPSTRLDDATFLPVVVDPGKILCIGVNYRDHQLETGKVAPPAPTVF